MLKRLKATPEAQCVTLEALPGRLKTRYRRLALISTRRQLEPLNPADEETLVVSCDWLLAQQEIANGRHIAYFEFGLRDWTEKDDLDTELFNHANDWLHVGTAGDPTMFDNISLGRLFGAEISMAVMNYYRIERSLRKLIHRFRPEEICFFDYIYEINLLSLSLRKWIVESVARDCGVRMIDGSRDVSREGHRIADTVYRRREHGPFSHFLIAVYTRLLEKLTELRCFFPSPADKVLVLVNTNLALPLLQNYSGSAITPVFLAQTVPKKLSLLWHCLRQGVLLINLVKDPLSKADRSRLGDIQGSLEDLLSKPAPGVLGFVRAYVRQQLLDPGHFADKMAEIRAAERILNNWRPGRVVVDGVRNSPPRAFIEVARLRNIPVDYIWHSPLTPNNHKMDALGGDPRYPRAVSRCLSWGLANEQWMDVVDAPPSRVRVGAPLGDKYGAARAVPTRADGPRTGENVLVLQYTFVSVDLAGLNANMYEHFVGTLRELRRLGYRNVRFKLHPGPGRWNKRYFEAIADYFGLECDILKSETFHECLEWADIVVGPMASGSMAETLAAGKPYYAFLLSPHTLDSGYYAGYPLLTSVDLLADALASDFRAEGRDLLDRLYASAEIPNPSERFWEVLAAGAA